MERDAATLPNGSLFEDRYEIQGELGSGGFGRVYRARQLSTGQSVAIKLLSAREGTEESSGREVDRFRRETQICAALSHAFIVQLIDSGETGAGQLYAVFAHVPGETLEQALARDGALPVRECVRLMTQVLDALACAHAKGIVHRNLKPANLMLSGTGARRNALVLDFGLGGLAEGRRRKQWQTLTQSREFLGTPLYAAPEQLAGETPTPRADLYAWGLIFLECLTGRHPFEEARAAARLLTGGGAVEIPDWLQGHRLGELLAAVTAREAEKRDVSVEVLIEALEQIAGEPLPVAPVESTVPPPLAERGERRHLTVLFCDLVDSAGLAQRLGAEAYHRVVRSYQARSTEAIERYDGHVAQYLGDGLLVYFGHPRAHEDDAERAVRAGHEILQEFETLNPQLQTDHGMQISVRIAIHAGPVVVGELGAGERKETLALGDTPTIAARLQGVAEPNTVVISDATLRLVAGLFVTEDRGTPSLKGISEPIRVHRVLRPSGVSSRLDRTPGLTPFVGRNQELGLLLDRFEQVQESQGQAVLIAGEAGVGKSRLVHQLRERLRETPHSWLECRSSPYTQNSALCPVIELLEQILGFGDEHSPEEKLGQLERGLAHVGLEPTEAVPLFAGLLSLRLPERYAPLEISPQLQRQKMLEALLAWLLVLGEKQPVVLLVEDLHWTDPSTLKWLGLLIEQCPTAGVLLLLTFRPEFEPPWPTRAHQLPMGLNRLSRRQAKALVEAALSGEALPEPVVDQLAARSDGIPLFVEELAKGVVDSGHDLTGSLSGLEIPETLQDSLMARLDRLDDAKEVAQLGAALGREFPYALLESVAPMKEVALRERLGRVVEAELLYQRGLPPKATYTFKHVLVQDTAYQSLLESQRHEIHGRIADALEARFPERVTREPEESARHCEEAGRTEQAIAHYQRAGDRAMQRFAYGEAIAHLRWALELLRTLPESTEHGRQELSLQTRLGGALLITQKLSSAELEQAYVRAHHLSEQLGDARELFVTLNRLHEVYQGRSDHDKARELGEEMFRRARGTQNPEQLLVARLTMAASSFWHGEFSRTLKHLEEAIGRCDPQEYRAHKYLFSRAYPAVAPHIVLALCYASWVLWHLGYPDQALARSREARALAQELSHPFSQALGRSFAPLLYLWRGEYRVALEGAEALIALANEHGFLLHLRVGAMCRAVALTLLGQLDEGIAELRAVLDATQASGNEVGSSVVLATLAQALGNAGQVEEGFAVLTETQAFVASSGERMSEAETHRVEGDLLLAHPTPDHAQAEAAFREALEVARRQSAKSFELRAATSLARLWQRQGRKEEARALLTPCYDWFTEGFDTADLKDAKALLEELA